jgi:preprotein translocase subunit SecA
VLVGTRSVAASQELAQRLDALALPYNLLNAVHHEQEARIVVEAGQPARITIATNMAGRGTDIRLAAGVAEKGGLHVVATERHEAGRIDRQLFGRCARQGDPGTVHVFISTEDDLFRRFLPQPLRRSLTLAVRARRPGAARLACRACAYAQYVAQRQSFLQRQQVLRTDTWIDEALIFTGSLGFV